MAVIPGVRVSLVSLLLVGLSIIPGLAQQTLRLRVERWIGIQQLSGTVIYMGTGEVRRAQVGDRLESAGEGIRTGNNSVATLVVDTGIGIVEVFPNSVVELQSLEYAPDNGRITRLRVNQGQVRVKVRRFTHQGSQLEIQTPAGTSSVRGTEFGVLVQPNGKTGLATLQGNVASLARQSTVEVRGGSQNFTIPGKAPSPAVPLQDNVSLSYTFQKVIENHLRKIRFVGQVDPVNGVTVNGVSRVTDQNGRFSVLVPMSSFPKISVTVKTPLGKEKSYELVIR